MKECNVTLTTYVKIPDGANLVDGGIILPDGRRIEPVLGFIDAGSPAATCDELQMPILFQVELVEYGDTTIHELAFEESVQ